MAGWRLQSTFGARVRILLSQRVWSIGSLAMMTGASTGYIHRVVRGEQEPSWSLAVEIAKALGVSLDVLADDGPSLDEIVRQLL